MGTKQDNEALERKLRPIYDALDARNWKAGLKLADAALKKYKHNQLIRSLKSYALSKSGKAAEALQICQELVKEGPEDELVLNTMTYTYKAVGKVEDITAAYLAATERSPANTELLSGLFAAYVRESNFVKQQQTATRLVKAAGAAPKQKPPEQQGQGQGPGQGSQGAAKYSWWAVCSLVLQARAALLGEPTSLPVDKLLQLAESMASRQASSSGVPSSYEELLLLLDILHGQGKHQQALQLLDKAGSDVLPLEADRQHLMAAALARSGNLAAAGDVYKSLALGNPDDWASWVLYLDCMLPASSAGAAGAAGTLGGQPLRFPVGVVGGLADLWDAKHPWRQHSRPEQEAAAAPREEAWQEAEATLAQLQQAVQAQRELQQQAERGSLRGPALAPLELALRRLRLARTSSKSKEEGADAAERAVGEEILRAYRATAGNFSCAADLRPGLQALASLGLRSWLAAEVHTAAASAGAAAHAAGSSNEAAAAAAAGSGVAEGSSSVGSLPGTASEAAGASVDHSSPAEGGDDTTPAAVGPVAAVNGAAEATAAGGPSNGGAAAAVAPGGDHTRNGARAGPADAAELRRFQTRVSAYQVEFELGLPVFSNPADAEAHAQQVLALYKDNLHLSASLDEMSCLAAASLDEKDRGYGEELACIAAAALLRAGQLELAAAGPRQACKRLLQALLVIEAAQVRRRVSAPLRLAACALYGLAGAPKEAAASLAALDIKFILHDTLTGHWLLPLLLGAGAEPADLKRWLTGIGFLHEDHEREAGETLMLAYYSGTYSKVVEFVDFKQRLAASHTWALGRTEEAALKLRSAAVAGAVATPLLLAALKGVGYLQEGGLPQGQSRSARCAAADVAGRPEEEAPCCMPGLRFNEDLSTRPAWLPPAAGPCRLAVAEWWEAWARGGCQGGYAQCWWAGVGAADGSQGAEARSWRLRQAANLAQRRLLPGLLLAALSSRPTPAEHAALGGRLRELVGVLRQGGGEASAAAAAGEVEERWDEQLEACLAQRAQQAAHASSGNTAALQTVHLALFAGAHALHAALLDSTGSAAATAASRLAQLQSLLAMLCQRVAASLAAPEGPEAGPLLGALPPSEGVCLASALLLEEGVWLAGCLQAWAKLLKPAGGKGKPPGEQQGPMGELRSALRSLSAAAAQGVAHVREALDALLASTQQQQVRQLAADLDLFGAGGAHSDGPPGTPAAALRTLWAFEPDFKPLEVLQKLVCGQREVLERLQGQAKAVLGMLAAAQL